MAKNYPKDWSQEKLSNISLDITVGFVGTMSNFFVEEGVPLLRGQNIKPYILDLSNIKYIPEHIHNKWKKSSLKAGDVVIVRVGYPGTACVIPEGLGELNAASLVIVRPDKTKLNSYFLTYLLNSPWGQATISGMLVGAAQQVFNTTSAAELVIPLPPISIQNRIVDILSAYDDLIENNTHRIRILEQMAQAIYQEWFGKVDKESLPKGWRLANLSNIADVNSTSIKNGNEPEEINYVDIASVSTGKIDAIQPMKFSEAPGRARRIVRHGDVIWSTVRPNRKSYSLIINPPENMIVSTGFAVLRAKTVPFSYLYLATTTEDFAGYLTNHATGSAYPAVNSSDFENAEIVLPPNELLNEFDNTVSPMFILRKKLLAKNNNLRQTRDMLLPRLVSGEIDVSSLS